MAIEQKAGVSFKDVSFRWPNGEIQFEDLNFEFGPVRTGIVGSNGSGKSTLLCLAADQIEPTGGTVVRHGSFHCFDQTFEHLDGLSLAQYFECEATVEANMRAIAGKASADDLEIADWDLEQRIQDAMTAMGIEVADFTKTIGAFSGGQKARLALAKLCLANADVLLLDEPTNSLDGNGCSLVRKIISDHKGACIVVSHDRELLRQMDQIAEISGGEVKLYGGNWDTYRSQKDAELAAIEQDARSAKSELKKIKQQNQQIRERKAQRDARGRAAGRSGSQPKILIGKRSERAQNTGAKLNSGHIQSQQAAEARAAETGQKLARRTELNIELSRTNLSSRKTALKFEEVSAAYLSKEPVLEDVSFSIIGPARVAVSGENGSGKSSLLKIAARKLEPLCGAVTGTSAFAYFDQEAALPNPDQTIAHNFASLHPELTQNDCRAALAQFGFRADAALKVAKQLSGGERLRAALACTLSGRNPPELIILDEPTNHLDIYSIEFLERALSAYDGALLVVSHDREFLQSLKITQNIDLSRANL